LGQFQLAGREAGTYRLEFGDTTTAISHGPIDSVGTDTILMRQFTVRLPSEPLSRPMAEYEVDAPVRPIGGTPPRYPVTLRDLGVCGNVLVTFVVDTTGRAEMNTFRVLRSTDPQFGEAVREGVARSRFTPARFRDHPVRQLVQQPFDFSMVSTRPGPCPTSREQAIRERCRIQPRTRADSANHRRLGCGFRDD
jgi:TonB family protein